MSSICKKCKHCWSNAGKLYCNSFKNVKYSKNKKQCKHFEVGTNYKRFRKLNGSNRNKKSFW